MPQTRMHMRHEGKFYAEPAILASYGRLHCLKAVIQTSQWLQLESVLNGVLTDFKQHFRFTCILNTAVSRFQLGIMILT